MPGWEKSDFVMFQKTTYCWYFMNLVEMSFWVQQKPFSIYHHCMGLSIWQYACKYVNVHPWKAQFTPLPHQILHWSFFRELIRVSLNLFFCKIFNINDIKRPCCSLFSNIVSVVKSFELKFSLLNLKCPLTETGTDW